MSPDTIVEIAQSCSQVVALKQADDNLMDFRRIRREAPESFVMLSGDDANAIPMMALGGEGLISVIGNAYPDVWAEAMDLALFGSVKEADQHLAAHRSMMDVLFAEGNPTGIKAVCDLLGLCGPSPRMPLMPASTPTARSSTRPWPTWMPFRIAPSSRPTPEPTTGNLSWIARG